MNQNSVERRGTGEQELIRDTVQAQGEPPLYVIVLYPLDTFNSNNNQKQAYSLVYTSCFISVFPVKVINRTICCI